MTKVLYVVPGVGLDEAELGRRRDILNSFATHGVQYDVKAVTEGPPSIESIYDEYMAVPGTLKLIREAEATGYDAAIIGCYGDPGLDAAREIVSIPVIGPGEASMLFAAMVGRKFSIVTILRSVFPALEAIADRLGVSKNLASMKEVGIHVLDLAKDTEHSMRMLTRAGKEAVEQDGADTLVLGCMSEAFLGFDKKISKELGVPVINPVLASVRSAEALCSMGISHSRKAYSATTRIVA